MDTPLPAPDIQEMAYDRDFHAWTGRQAALLRAGKLDEADIAHIAEEIEDLGKSTKAALSSQVRRVLVHLMKLQASPATEPRAGWQSTIANARAEIEALLEDNPSLRRELAEIVAREVIRARRVAEAELAARGERAESIAGLVYDVDRVLGLST